MLDKNGNFVRNGSAGISRGPMGPKPKPTEYSAEANRFANMYDTHVANQAQVESDRIVEEARAAAALAAAAAVQSGQGGGGPNYKLMIDELTKRIGTSNSGFKDILNKLNGYVTDARGDIRKSGRDTSAYLGTLDPMATRPATLNALQAPTAAVGDYLASIGANPSELNAVQMLGQQLLNSQMGADTQYANNANVAQQNFRQAQIAQAMMNAQTAGYNTRSSADAYRMQIEAARQAKEDSLMDMILKYRLAQGS